MSAKLQKFQARITKYNFILTEVFGWIGVAALVFMMLVTFVDVVSVKVFNTYFIKGGIDLASFSQIIVLSFATSMSMLLNRHIAVEVVFERLNERGRLVMDAIATFLVLVFFVVLVWQMWLWADAQYTRRTVSFVLLLPMYPFAYAMTVAFIVVCLGQLQKFTILVTAIVRKGSQ